MKSDFSSIFMLVPMPCGCITEVLSLVPEGGPLAIYTAVECPWCLATVLAEDMRLWLDNRSQCILLESPRPLFKFGDRLLEFAGKQCSCGSPILREHRGSEEIHFDFEPNLFEAVRN